MRFLHIFMMFNTRLKVISLFILIGLIIYPMFSDKTLLPGARLDVYVSLVLSILLFLSWFIGKWKMSFYKGRQNLKELPIKRNPKKIFFITYSWKYSGILLCVVVFLLFFLTFKYFLNFLCFHLGTRRKLYSRGYL